MKHRDNMNNTKNTRNTRNNKENLFVNKISVSNWLQDAPRTDWAKDIEEGRILHFDCLPFGTSVTEQRLFDENAQSQKARNISLDSVGNLKGVSADFVDQELLSEYILRFRALAQQLVISAFPKYREKLRIAPTSFRPKNVESRSQSIRADDKRLHVDAFPTRPNYGERILRVFLNINPYGKPRVWRVGEPFADIAKQFIPKIKPYSKWQANLLKTLRVTKSLRSEYDHLMLGIHDGMKMSDSYQSHSDQITYNFAPGSVWICFSDQTAHAVMAGQFMMEQTYHLPIDSLYSPETSPLSILQEMTNKNLI